MRVRDVIAGYCRRNVATLTEQITLEAAAFFADDPAAPTFAVQLVPPAPRNGGDDAPQENWQRLVHLLPPGDGRAAIVDAARKLCATKDLKAIASLTPQSLEGYMNGEWYPPPHHHHHTPLATLHRP